MASETKLLTAREAAQFLRLSENTVRQWIWQRRLPVVRLGRAVRLRKADLEKLLERHYEGAVAL
jgi:excisionase family DNA binding protein